MFHFGQPVPLVAILNKPTKKFLYVFNRDDIFFKKKHKNIFMETFYFLSHIFSNSVFRAD